MTVPTSGSAFCIEAPRGRHLPDPDTSWGAFTGFCRYCSAEIELREDAEWHLPGPRILSTGKIARVIGGAIPLRGGPRRRPQT